MISVQEALTTLNAQDRNQDFLREVYAVLVELGRAHADTCEDFVSNYANNQSAIEWRFCGRFGFGGKFYRTPSRCYVSYYFEDRTSDLDVQIDAMNEQIAALVIKHQPKV